MAPKASVRIQSQIYLSSWVALGTGRLAQSRPLVSGWFYRVGTPLLLALVLLLTWLWQPVLAQTAPISNPDLAPRCGLDIILAIDESGSFQGFESTMRYGVRALLDLVADMGSRVALVEFNLDARAPLGLGYLPVTSGAGGTISPGGAFDLYLNNNYQPNGNTNWEAAFQKIEEINRTQGAAPLVIFLTDGQPNAYVNPFGSILLGESAASLAEAVPAANAVKAQGSHIFAVGVGASPADEGNLIAITDANRYPAVTLRSGQADYLMTNLGGLETALRRLVFDLCAASLSVVKRENLGDGQGYVVKAGQRFTTTVNINEPGQAVTAFDWLEPSPGAASVIGASQPLDTNSNGVARWQWLPGSRQTPQNWAATVTLAEAPSPNTTVAAATCTRKSINSDGIYQVDTLTILPFPAALTIGAYDLVTCDVRNAQLGIALKKTASPSSVPESGGDVRFTFELTNHSTVAVRITALNDSVFGNLHNQGDCVAGGFTVIDAGKSYSCTITKRLAGNTSTPHQNTVTATVIDANQRSVTAQAAANVTFTDAVPAVTFIRSAAPLSLAEPGGPVVYTLQVTNNSPGEPVTLSALTDMPYGVLTTVGGAISATTCAVPQTLAPAGQSGATYRCTFTVPLTGPPGPYTDTATATISDDDGNRDQVTSDQLVTIVNAPPAASLSITPAPATLPEPGGPVQFTLAVANTSAAEAITLSALTDSRYGTLTTVGGAVTATTCAVPQTLAPAGQPNATYQCTFTTLLTGAPGTYANTVQATVSDDDGGTLQVEQASSVEITDLPSSLLVTKRATPNALPEPGGPVTFTVMVLNTSAVDAVRVDRLLDDQFGEVGATCLPALPTSLAPQAELRCRFVRTVTGATGTRHVNQVIAFGVDDDGKAVSDRDEETVEITDLPARLDILQVAEPANLPEPGGTVTFTAFVENSSAVDTIQIERVETNAVTGNAAVNVSSTCTPALPADLPPHAQLRCRFTKQFTGPIGARHTSIVTVTGTDDDGVAVKQSGYETVEIVNLPSSIRVTASADPVTVPESGGAVTFALQIQNTSKVDAVTITTLTNSQWGAVDSGCLAPLPALLAPGATLTCTVTHTILGDTGALNSQHFTASGLDDDGVAVSDDVTVAIGIIDTPSAIKVVQLTTPNSIAEPGGTVAFSIEIENTSPVDTVTIATVQDSRYGDLSSSCLPTLPAPLAPQQKVLCQLSRTLSGDAGTIFASTVSASGVDDDGQPVADFDLLVVDVTDVLPQVLIDLTANPNQVLESGGLVTFTVNVVNQGPEAITVEQLVDNSGARIAGAAVHTAAQDALAAEPCQLPQLLAASGGSYRCTYQKLVTGVHSQSYQALVTATALDNEGNRVQVADEADVFLLAVAPALRLTKRDLLLVDTFTSEADRGKPSPGDTLGYEIVVRNIGNGPATGVILTDIPDANTKLVVGSVQTSTGTVVVGNSGNAQLVVVDLGDVASGEQVTIAFAVTIIDGAGATLVRNQATLSQGITGAAVAGSDDPDTPFFGDPTDTVVTIPPTGLPPEEEPLSPTNRYLFLPLITQR